MNNKHLTSIQVLELIGLITSPAAGENFQILGLLGDLTRDSSKYVFYVQIFQNMSKYVFYVFYVFYVRGGLPGPVTIRQSGQIT